MPQDSLGRALLSESPPPSSPSLNRSVSTPGTEFFERFRANQKTAAPHQVIDDLVGVLNAVLIETEEPPPPPVLHKSVSDQSSMPRQRLYNGQAPKKVPPFSSTKSVQTLPEEKTLEGKEEKKELMVCQICYEDEENAKDVARVCANEECLGVFCTACVETFVRAKVKDSLGTCPLIRCPSCAHFVPFSKWRQRVPEDLAKQYEKNAKSVLELQCGSCHTPKTLLKEFDEKVDVEARMKMMLQEIVKARSQKVADEFAVSFRQYISLELTPMQFLDIVVDTFSNAGAAMKQLLNLQTEVAGLNAQVATYRASIDIATEEGTLDRSILRKEARTARLKQKLDNVDKAKCCSIWSCLCCLFPCCPNTTPCFSCVNKLAGKWHTELTAINLDLTALRSQKGDLSTRIEVLVGEKSTALGLPALKKTGHCSSGSTQ
jgi:hypothetical protein